MSSVTRVLRHGFVFDVLGDKNLNLLFETQGTFFNDMFHIAYANVVITFYIRKIIKNIFHFLIIFFNKISFYQIYRTQMTVFN